MKARTLREARRLVGRTFESEGKRRTITRIVGGTYRPHDNWNAYWCRPGQRERAIPVLSYTLETWLKDAIEVKNDERQEIDGKK